MLTKMIYAAIAALAVTSNAPQSLKAVVIISDASRSAASRQLVDLHDVTGHHRYYGLSACIGA
jgi:hypothetical protein